MFAEYWWVFILIIFVIMLVYPTSDKQRHRHIYRNKNKKFVNNFDSGFVLSNLNTITSYYVGIN